MDVTYDHFIDRLGKAAIEYAVFRRDGVTYVEVGRFGYRFDEQGESTGGWIHYCGEDWRSEWQEWLARFNEP